MAESAKQYFTRICREAGKTDAEIAALVAVMDDPKVATSMDETVRRATDDFSAMKGRYESAKSRAEELENWYPKANNEYQRVLAELEELKGAGSNGFEAPAFDANKYLTKTDFEAMVKERDARYSNVIKQATRLASRHAAKYSEELDVDALEKLAVEKNMPLESAYREWVAPREEEARLKQFQKEKEEYAAQKLKDYASQHKLPVDTRPPEVAPIHRRGVEAPKDMEAEMLAAWQGHAAS